MRYAWAMARYPSNTALADPRLREVIGAAIYAKLALALNQWGSTSLEKEFLKCRDSTPPGRATTLDPTNQFQQMVQGRVPEAVTLKVMEKVAGLEQASLQSIPTEPFWTLLQEADVSDLQVLAALDGLKGGTRDAIFEEAGVRIPGQGALRSTVTLDVLDWLSEIGDFEALVALTAIARQFRTWRLLRETEWAGLRSRAVFPRAIASRPEFYFRWRHMALLFLERVWLPQLSPYSVPTFGNKWNELSADMTVAAMEARKLGTRLPADAAVAFPARWDEITSLAREGSLTIPAISLRRAK